MLNTLSQHQNWYIQENLCLAHTEFPTIIKASIFYVLFVSIIQINTIHDAAFIQGWHLLILLL